MRTTNQVLLQVFLTQHQPITKSHSIDSLSNCPVLNDRGTQSVVLYNDVCMGAIFSETARDVVYVYEIANDTSLD